MDIHLHGTEPASSWVQRWSHLVKPAGRVLDVACGHGRHARWFHERKHPVTLVDRSQQAIESITLPQESCEKVVADIENGPWPFAGRHFEGVIVTNYLWRPLMPALLASVATGGVLIYETFTQGNETVGKPSKSDFLLRHGELLEVCAGLRVVAYEDGFQADPNADFQRFIQRIAAVKEAPAAASTPGPARYYLS